MTQNCLRVLAALALLCGLSQPAVAQPQTITVGPISLSGSTCAPGGTTSSCGQIGIAGYGTASVTIIANPSVGTVTFTGQNFSGTPFNNLGCTSMAAGSAPANTTTSAGTFICPVAGLSVLRATVSGGGAVIVTMRATQGGGAGGGGGGASGSVTQGTNPWIVSGDGTAGTSSAGVMSIQGITSMTPVQTTAAQSGTWNVGQTGSPWGVAGSLSNNNAVPTSNQVDVMPCVVGASAPSYTDGRSVKPRCGTGGEQYVNVTNGSTTDADDASVAAGQSALAVTIPLNYQYNGSAWVRATADPCSYLPKTRVVVNIASATTTQLIAASSSNFNYICDLDLFVSAADNVALVEDDTAACASPTAGMAGGTTAATGWVWIANQGISKGNGNGTVYKTAATNRYTCLITSTTAQVSGSLSYVQNP